VGREEIRRRDAALPRLTVAALKILKDSIVRRGGATSLRPDIR